MSEKKENARAETPEDQSYKFTRVREFTPRNAQFIEFWDMHSKMSYNLAFACIIFMGVLLFNWLSIPAYQSIPDLQLVIFIATFISFLVLLYKSLHYSFWWSRDLDESLKLTKKIDNKYSLNKHK